MTPDSDSAPPAYPLTFEPLFKERLWGGRRLAGFPGKVLPDGVNIGESWEVTDRPEGISVVANGPDRGRTLHDLMEQRPGWLTGGVPAPGGRFPWLVKFLDARDDLSLQVHPPAHRAQELGGEPKTELWYVVAADPGARLYTGLRRGVTRAEFERRTRDGSVAELFHVHPVTAGDVMFLPSGRVHALGAGNLVFEIQQNSDTTYRVFDWNRVGPDGRARELHLEPSFASIQFFDCEPGLVAGVAESIGAGLHRRKLVRDPLFSVDHWTLDPGAILRPEGGVLTVVAVVEGSARVSGGGVEVILQQGGVAVLPAALECATVVSESGAECLIVAPGVPRVEGPV